MNTIGLMFCNRSSKIQFDIFRNFNHIGRATYIYIYIYAIASGASYRAIFVHVNQLGTQFDGIKLTPHYLTFVPSVNNYGFDRLCKTYMRHEPPRMHKWIEWRNERQTHPIESFEMVKILSESHQMQLRCGFNTCTNSNFRSYIRRINRVMICYHILIKSFFYARLCVWWEQYNSIVIIHHHHFDPPKA